MRPSDQSSGGIAIHHTSHGPQIGTNFQMVAGVTACLLLLVVWTRTVLASKGLTKPMSNCGASQLLFEISRICSSASSMASLHACLGVRLQLVPKQKVSRTI